MDDESASLTFSLQLEEIGALNEAQKGKHLEGQEPDHELALELYRQELANRDLLLSDRQLADIMSEGVESNADVIGATQVEENNSRRERRLTSTLSSAAQPFKPAKEDNAYIHVEDRLAEQLCRLSQFEDLLGGPRSSWESLTTSWSREVTKPAKKDSVDIEFENESARYISILDEFRNLYGTPTSRVATPRASSSRSDIDLPIRGGPRKVTCTACQDEKHWFDIVRVPCGHDYCRTYISQLFEASASDESLFPPRCCRQKIPLSSATHFLAPALLHKFREKSIELSTTNRTYCHRESCSAFIPPSRIHGNTGRCPSCFHETCTLCKQDSHNGDCPTDTGLQSLLDLSTAEGWQRCYSCRRVVELDTGCNHITCLCSAQFCYACGERWKTCPCDQWNEANLFPGWADVVPADAHARPQAFEDLAAQVAGLWLEPFHIVRPGARARPPAAEDEAQPIRRILEDGRLDHVCSNWRYLGGPHTCDECGNRLQGYIFQCTDCRMQACNRCRRNIVLRGW